MTILLDFKSGIEVKKFSLVVFDKDRSGFASSSEIKAVMANLGVHFTDDEMQEMMLEVGEQRDNFHLNSSSGRCQRRQPGGL